MKVLLINTHDRGGAGNACLRLHQGLLQSGIQSRIALKIRTKNLPFTTSVKPKQVKVSYFQKLRLKARRLLKVKLPTENIFLLNRDSRLELFSYPDSNFDITEAEYYKETDIINLHWVANFLDYSSFFKKNTKPVVWTLHDMNPFTGGEHYSEEFLGIDEKGNPTKRIVSEIEKKEFLKNLEVKKEALLNVSNLHIVTLCNWMYNEVKQSDLFKQFPIHLIPNGIDSSIFKPREQQYSRNLLGLPQNKKIILFVAESLENNRKGFAFLQKAIELIDQKDVVLCTTGIKIPNNESSNNIVDLGLIYDERLMSVIYSAADVFIIPSLMDNLPNTVLESLLCGTPVIGFPVGGIIDMIKHGENGYITEEVSVNSLVIQLNKFLETTNTFKRDLIRDNAVKKYDKKIQTKKYNQLFNEVLNKSKM